METFSALLVICAGNSPVPGEFPSQRPVTRSFDVFFDLRLNKRLSKQSQGWWFETLSRPSWRHGNALAINVWNEPVIHSFDMYLLSSWTFFTNNRVTSGLRCHEVLVISLVMMGFTHRADGSGFELWFELNCDFLYSNTMGDKRIHLRDIIDSEMDYISFDSSRHPSWILSLYWFELWGKARKRRFEIYSNRCCENVIISNIIPKLNGSMRWYPRST